MAKFESKHNIGECVKIRNYYDAIYAGIIENVKFEKVGGEIIPAYLCKVGIDDKTDTIYVYDYENAYKGNRETAYTIAEDGGYEYAYRIEIHYRDGKNDSSCTDDWGEIEKYLCDAIKSHKDITSILVTKYGESVIDYNAAYDD
ncbi:MAG: hypothetical protein VZR36_08870 [Prevotella sp.]|nr:hypothetical protein [Prevotella sp.]